MFLDDFADDVAGLLEEIEGQSELKQKSKTFQKIIARYEVTGERQSFEQFEKNSYGSEGVYSYST